VVTLDDGPLKRRARHLDEAGEVVCAELTVFAAP
jgi:hypothetical protein